ncbi:MAG: tetratricopeptide repeat protein [Deltaproteobacteria bacterium]|nr:tetratricopeptide repeat protein [Deltaproteobacteria bacterium]
MAKKKSAKDDLEGVELPEELAALAPPDPFLERAQEYAGVIEKNSRLFGAALGGVLLLAVAVIVIQSQMKGSRAKATTGLTDAVKEYRDALEKADTATTAAIAQAAADKLVPAFQKLQTEQPGTGIAELSKLYEGDLLRRAGKPADAEKTFKSFIDAAKPDDNLLFLALEGAGYAAEETGNVDGALVYFQRLSTLPTEHYRDHGFYHLGRLNEAKGNKDAAIAAYKAIADNYPKSPLREKIDGRLAALK